MFLSPKHKNMNIFENQYEQLHIIIIIISLG